MSPWRNPGRARLGARRRGLALVPVAVWLTSGSAWSQVDDESGQAVVLEDDAGASDIAAPSDETAPAPEREITGVKGSTLGTPEATPSQSEREETGREGANAASAQLVSEKDAAKTGDESAEKSKDFHEGSFQFGSYGRINVASDLEGRVAADTDIVSFGTRYDLDNYAELEFRREDKIGDMLLKEVITLAVAGEFFHFDADFQENLALRNLYVSVSNALFEGNELWAGQRMVRGDDIYLINLWPLDNLNITGGGIVQTWDRVQAAVTVGQYRPNQPYYYQTDELVSRTGFETVQYPVLNRPRTVVAGRLVGNLPFKAGAGGKLVLYGEHHSIAAGTRKDENDTLVQLPADNGFVVGAQVGLWRAERKGFVNVFARCAFGLAVYDPLFTPFQVGTPTETDGARDCTTGLAANLELSAVGIQAGGYLRSFQDQENQIKGGGAMVEGIVDVRPYIWIGQKAGVQLDMSYQSVVRAETDASGRQVGGSEGKFAIMPFFSPWGRGTYTRPHISVVYALTLRDEGARRLYPVGHAYADGATSHYLGVGAEWWFNSSSY